MPQSYREERRERRRNGKYQKDFKQGASVGVTSPSRLIDGKLAKSRSKKETREFTHNQPFTPRSRLGKHKEKIKGNEENEEAIPCVPVTLRHSSFYCIAPARTIITPLQNNIQLLSNKYLLRNAAQNCMIHRKEQSIILNWRVLREA